jgi:hypothetical protein
MEARLTSEFWVKAYLRRCAAEGVAAMQMRRGQSSSGAVLIRVNRLDGHSTVLVRGTLPDGRSGWLLGAGAARVSDAEADRYIDRQIKFDPDLWVIEVEDREGRHFLGEPVEV